MLQKERFFTLFLPSWSTICRGESNCLSDLFLWRSASQPFLDSAKISKTLFSSSSFSLSQRQIFFIFPRNVLFFGKKILLAEKSFFRPLSFSFLVYVKQRRQDPSRAKNTYFSSIKIIPKTPFSIKNQRIENYPVRFSLKREVFRQNRLFFIPAIKIILRQAQEKSVFIFFSAVFSCALESISSFLYKNIFLRRFIFYAFKIYFCVVFSRETLFFRFFVLNCFTWNEKMIFLFVR